MSEASFRELIILASAGLGVFAFAFLLFVAGRSRRWVVGGGLSLAAAGSGLGATALIDLRAGWMAAGLTAAIAGGVLALGSAWVASVLAACHGPAVRVGGLGVIGLTLLLGGIVRYDAQDDAATDADEQWMTKIGAQPPTQEETEFVVRTDRDRRLHPREPIQPRSARELRDLATPLVSSLPQSGLSIARQPASDVCNCHGWVFTGGRYWLGPDDVQAVLDENGYDPVTDPRPGDLAIYRQDDQIIHTALVRAVGDQIPVLVEGKWGWMGVYMHPVDATCYGKNVTFYRSPREGHLLVGLGGRTSDNPGAVHHAALDPVTEGGQ